MASRKKKVAAPPEEPPPEPGVELIELVEWRGIKIDAHYRSRYCGAPHLELHVIDPPLRPIPVTDTGYISHFHPSLPEDIPAAGGLTPFVLAWLDHEAQNRWWQACEEVRNRPKQLDLFG